MKPSKAGAKKLVASDVGTNVDKPMLPWTSRLWASVGLPWILTGLATYTFLTVLGRQFLHNPKGLEVLREQVPLSVYDRSTSIFLTALAIDLLNIVFERQTIKVDCVLLPAFIKGMASTTNLLVRFFVPVMALTDAGRPVVVQRYICWMHTTPSILLLLKMISTTITAREALMAILADEVMVITGVAALVTTGWQRVLWSVITHVAMLPVVPYMHKAFTEAMEQVRTRSLQLTMLFIYVLNLLLWCVFAVTWDLALLGWISVLTEEVLYVGCDFSAKVLFSSTLMLSSFKEFEARRENAMRVIENSSKAKLITELQALLEQKERFMSSVSHELRTPLNGIIGISEGMLSGCCGVLPEGVRRQIYIIRTSGARLLALINDVMDAAALRQNKLVLKQEQVVLRHVVDDVLDLTRSLVDSEVTLANLVPPRMLVMGDTGRIVQILNNLLGNAAKFTRRGQIRVTARQVEGGRRVAVTVSDTGIGIPRNKLATIFLPFEQVDMSISRKYGGFGLGLNIVQELVKAHGCTINVSSIEGKGSAFTFTLPLARAMGRESLEEARAAAQRGSSLAGCTQDGSAAGLSGASGSGGIRSAIGGASGTAVTGTGTTSASATVSGIMPRMGEGAGDDSSTVISSSDASRRPVGRAGQGAGENATESELEQYGELMYNAAELSALASSRPYAQSVRDSMPASLDGINSAAVQSPLIGTAATGHEGATHVTKRGPRAMKGAAGAMTATVVAPDSATAEDSGSKDVANEGAGDGLLGLLPGEMKIMHGPRPFHYTMYKRFLLLSVDDDSVNQSVIKSLLGSTGYEVVAVSSGVEALRYVSTAPALPDLVLLDCMMPEMDGYEVLQRLRTMTPNVHVPIIMVSAQTEEEHVVCGLDLGADDYVTKPFKRNELLARIRAQLAYGEWEHDEGAMETISSLMAGEFHSNVSAHPHTGAVELESGNGDVSGASGAVGAANVFNPAAAAAAADAAATAAAAAESQTRMSTSLLEGSVSLGDQRLIVCIDDDDVNQVVLQGMLTSQHYRYVRASTGSQGLSIVCGTQNGGIPPDLVLLDCSLPDMTGFDVCRCIRQMYNKQQVPIIMLSARHNESAVVEGLKCGANTYVTKPFRRNELLARIRLHLRSREPAQGPTQSQGDSGAVDSELRAGSAATSVLIDSAVQVGSQNAHRHSGIAAATTATSYGGPAAMMSALSAAGGSLAGGGGAVDSVEGSSGVRIWTEAAVLVVAVADYAGLCRMLLPAEMAELSARMVMAFDSAVAAYGAVRIEASNGVMSAAVLPAALPSLLGAGADADAANVAAAAAAAAAGLRLAALHRVGRALLEAAATLPVPGTSTCLQLQEALALGTIMGHCTAPAAGSTMLYFGPVLAELLDLARRAPPMTMVSPDGEAQALRASGATADIRGPLFLEPEDSGGGGDGGDGSTAVAAANGTTAARRLWLVEAHPFAHQYLPPQLLFSSSLMRGSFFQRSMTFHELDALEKGSGSTALAATMHLAPAAAAPVPAAVQLHLPLPPASHPHPSPRGLSTPTAMGLPAAVPGPGLPSAPAASLPGPPLPLGPSGGSSSSAAAAATALAAGGSSPVFAYPIAGMMASVEPGHTSSVSNSMGGFNPNLGLYGYGLGISRAMSRAFSQTAIYNGPDSEALSRMGLMQPFQALPPPPPPSRHVHPVLQHGALTTQTYTGSGNGGNVSQANGTASGAAAGGAMFAAAAAAGGGISGVSSSLSQNHALGSPTGHGNARESASGGPCITFSLQAAAAAVAAAAAAASGGAGGGGGGGGGSGHLSIPPEPFLMTYGTPQAGCLSPNVGLSGMLLYGNNQRASSSASASNPGGYHGSGGAAAAGGGGGPPLDLEVTAAEPQIRALRNELAAMRMQLEALQSGVARDQPAQMPMAKQGLMSPQLQLPPMPPFNIAAVGSTSPSQAGTSKAWFASQLGGPHDGSVKASGGSSAAATTVGAGGTGSSFQLQYSPPFYQPHNAPPPPSPALTLPSVASQNQPQQPQRPQLLQGEQRAHQETQQHQQQEQQLQLQLQQQPHVGASQGGAPAAAVAAAAAASAPAQFAATSTDGVDSNQQPSGTRGAEKAGKKAGSKWSRLFTRSGKGATGR
ncbi:hypothetical protein Vafri_15766 [Volvox africanus]|nr:hypothetical protein Vafri_15766 [Volvox africanus]